MTNWFSVAAGLCFVAAVIYGIVVLGQDWRILAMYSMFAGINFISATL